GAGGGALGAEDSCAMAHETPRDNASAKAPRIGRIMSDSRVRSANRHVLFIGCCPGPIRFKYFQLAELSYIRELSPCGIYRAKALAARIACFCREVSRSGGDYNFAKLLVRFQISMRVCDFIQGKHAIDLGPQRS